jgi:TonB family protein
MDPARMPPRARKGALSWVIALALHAALIAICAIIAISPQARTVEEVRIDLSFQSSAETAGAGEQGASSLPVRSARPVGPVGSGKPEVSRIAVQGVETKEGHVPAASAVEVPSVQPGGTQVEDAAPDSSVVQPPAGERIGWDGSARKLVHWRDPAFPALLSAAGQEVECEARITVAASGAVTRVEITRSSGYIEIDASVEAALRDDLFSRINERKDTVGTIRFRFRLERQD